MSKGEEENEEIDRGLLKKFLLLRTVVPAICNMGKRVLPTVQALSEVARNASGEGEGASQTTPGNKDTKAQEHDKGSKVGGGGAAHGECQCSSLRVRGWWIITINSHGIGISIAGGVEEMVCDYCYRSLVGSYTNSIYTLVY